MGEERAETYLRLLAEAQLRNAVKAAGRDGATALGRNDLLAASHQISFTGGLLVMAGLVEGEVVDRLERDLQVALAVRSPDLMRHSAGWVGSMLFRPPEVRPPRQHPAPRPMRITPIGRSIAIASERAPSELHLLTLVRMPDRAAITVAMRMHWPSDGSSADLEITGAGPQHLPYDQLGAVDDAGARYRVSLAGEGGTAAWHGIALLSPVPPPERRWLDLVADGTRPITRLDLSTPPGETATVSRDERAIPGAERVLAKEAERVMAAACDPRGRAGGGALGHMVGVLTDAGAIAEDSPLPGQLGTLCDQLGAERHGLAGAAELPGPWASILAQRGLTVDRPDSPEVFAPLGAVLPDIDGTRFVLAGLSSAAGQSQLHVVASGLPQRTAVLMREADDRFSWWLNDGAHWHLAAAGDPDEIGPGQGAFRLRLTPPLTSVPDTVEVTVRGSAGRARAVVPVRTTAGR